MDQSAAYDLLAGRGWLSLMPTDFTAALLAICVLKRFAPQQPLYAAGDPPGGIFGIAEGAIHFTVALGSADSPAMHIGRAVSWTGLGPLLSDQPRRASIVAVDAVTTAYAPLPALQSMLASHPAWWKHIAQELLIEFDVLSSISNDLLIRSTARRCAAALLRFADLRFGSATATQPQVLRVTQEMLSEMINSSRSSVSLVLGKLVEQGSIELGYRSITLRDPLALQAVADGE